jgi:hypothetical protein
LIGKDLDNVGSMKSIQQNVARFQVPASNFETLYEPHSERNPYQVIRLGSDELRIEIFSQLNDVWGQNTITPGVSLEVWVGARALAQSLQCVFRPGQFWSPQSTLQLIESSGEPPWTAQRPIGALEFLISLAIRATRITLRGMPIGRKSIENVQDIPGLKQWIREVPESKGNRAQ